jgi:hypothetical protein
MERVSGAFRIVPIAPISAQASVAQLRSGIDLAGKPSVCNNDSKTRWRS